MRNLRLERFDREQEHLDQIVRWLRERLELIERVQLLEKQREVVNVSR